MSVSARFSATEKFPRKYKTLRSLSSVSTEPQTRPGFLVLKSCLMILFVMSSMSATANSLRSLLMMKEMIAKISD